MPEYKVQSVVVPKENFSQESAIEWVHIHNFKLKKVDETEHFYRFRQLSPSYLRSNGYNKYIAHKLENGVSLILVYKE